MESTESTIGSIYISFIKEEGYSSRFNSLTTGLYFGFEFSELREFSFHFGKAFSRTDIRTYKRKDQDEGAYFTYRDFGSSDLNLPRNPILRSFGIAPLVRSITGKRLKFGNFIQSKEEDQTFDISQYNVVISVEDENHNFREIYEDPSKNAIPIAPETKKSMEFALKNIDTHFFKKVRKLKGFDPRIEEKIKKVLSQ